MAEIAAGNVEVYVRQLLSEVLGNDGDPQNPARDQKLIEDEDFKLTNRRLGEESEG